MLRIRAFAQTFLVAVRLQSFPVCAQLIEASLRPKPHRHDPNSTYAGYIRCMNASNVSHVNMTNRTGNWTDDPCSGLLNLTLANGTAAAANVTGANSTLATLIGANITLCTNQSGSNSTNCTHAHGTSPPTRAPERPPTAACALKSAVCARSEWLCEVERNATEANRTRAAALARNASLSAHNGTSNSSVPHAVANATTAASANSSAGAEQGKSASHSPVPKSAARMLLRDNDTLDSSPTSPMANETNAPLNHTNTTMARTLAPVNVTAVALALETCSEARAACKNATDSCRESLRTPAPTEAPMPVGNITLDALLSCPLVTTALKSARPGEPYKFELMNLDDVAFFMIGDNEEKTLDNLDSIRRKRHKFICLNDNMNSSAPNPKVHDPQPSMRRYGPFCTMACLRACMLACLRACTFCTLHAFMLA
jgi:hypothetical protein